MGQTPAGPGQIQAVQQHVDSPAAVTAVAPSAPDTQEIPESVTAELEKLEQEGGAMVEVEGVGAILAELGDDKELLGKGSDKMSMKENTGNIFMFLIVHCILILKYRKKSIYVNACHLVCGRNQGRITSVINQQLHLHNFHIKHFKNS